MKIKLASAIRENGKSETWLEENAQDIYDTLRFDVKDEEHLVEVIDAMLALLPNMTRREDLRRWGKLLEQAYERTNLALNNGLHEDDKSFIMIKRAKKPQLPTITVRNKRLLVHPAQMFEMYLIMYMKYMTLETIPREYILEILKFANDVGDVYCLNKAHQAVAYIYNKQHKYELAIPHANTSYAYFANENNHVEAGSSAFILGTSYHQLAAEEENETDAPYAEIGDYATAEYWYRRSADHYAKTNFRHQYARVSFVTTALKFSARKLDEVLDWADVTLREAQQANSNLYIGFSYMYKGLAKGELKRYEEALADLEEAQAIFKSDEKNINHMLDVAYHIAYVHKQNGKFRLARQQIVTLQKLLTKYHGGYQTTDELDPELPTYRWDNLIAELQKEMLSDGEY